MEWQRQQNCTQFCSISKTKLEITKRRRWWKKAHPMFVWCLCLVRALRCFMVKLSIRLFIYAIYFEISWKCMKGEEKTTTVLDSSAESSNDVNKIKFSHRIRLWSAETCFHLFCTIKLNTFGAVNWKRKIINFIYNIIKKLIFDVVFFSHVYYFIFIFFVHRQHPLSEKRRQALNSMLFHAQSSGKIE